VVVPVAASISPYALLELGQPLFALDEETLEDAWLQRSRRVHPDRFVERSAKEKRFAVEQMAAANQAFSLLSDPVSRGEWWLEMLCLPTQAMPAEDFLMEMMEAREEAVSSPTKRQAHLKKAQKDFDQGVSALTEIFYRAQSAQKEDANQALADAPLKLTELRYYRRLIEQLGNMEQ